MTPKQAIAWVRRLGIALESARGPVPNLAQAVAGTPIQGGWWGHPKGHAIYSVACAVRGSRTIHVCRLVEGKITYVHRRLWPALVRLRSAFEPASLAAIREMHTAAGNHRVVTAPFPACLPPAVIAAARKLATDQAWSLLRAAWPGAKRRG